MSKHKNSSVSYSEGAVNVMMYNWKKIYSPGNKVKIRISSQMKLTKVSYCWNDGGWNDGERTEVSHLNNRCLFKVCVPSVDGNELVLKVFTEVQFQDGLLMEVDHRFRINDVYHWYNKY